MSQGYDGTKPAYQTPLASAEVRTNFNAVNSDNSGSAPPANPVEGMKWLDIPARTLKMYLEGVWSPVLEFDASGNVIFDGGTF